MAKRRVLILCTGNSARSQMAEGWLRELAGDDFEVFSAGTEPKESVHPLAVQVMADVGVNIAEQQPKSLQQYLAQPWDFIITVCDRANEACPIFPGDHERIHSSIEDPTAAMGNDLERRAVFQRVRDEILQRIRLFVAVHTR
jgi:arsenate reductase